MIARSGRRKITPGEGEDHRDSEGAGSLKKKSPAIEPGSSPLEISIVVVTIVSHEPIESSTTLYDVLPKRNIRKHFVEDFQNPSGQNLRI
jgi:hypothetical protein